MLRNSPSRPPCRRAAFATLLQRLQEPRRFIHVVAAPRQVGKTTLVQQVVTGLESPLTWASADDPGLRDRAWLGAPWKAARVLARRSPGA